MTYKSLLPPNAKPPEHALEQANNDPIISVPLKIREAKNPDTCPIHILPWLAWEYGVDFWDPTWSEAQKRQTVKDAAYIHQHKGTAGAVRRSLRAVGFPTRVIEWFDDTPPAAPYSFRVEVSTTGEINDELYQKISAQVNHAKNLRSYMTAIDVIADVGSDGEMYISGAITAHIEIDIVVGGE